jgi:hypothetical protein
MKALRSTLLLLGILTFVGAAHAQEVRLRANIPFDFVVGNRVLPAGEYELGKALVGANVIAIRDEDQPSTTMVGSHPCALSEPSKTSKLVFHRMGGEYFLYQIWVEGRDTGSEFSKSKLEIQMAKNHSNEDEVIVAALITR